MDTRESFPEATGLAKRFRQERRLINLIVWAYVVSGRRGDGHPGYELWEWLVNELTAALCPGSNDLHFELDTFARKVLLDPHDTCYWGGEILPRYTFSLGLYEKQEAAEGVSPRLVDRLVAGLRERFPTATLALSARWWWVAHGLRWIAFALGRRRVPAELSEAASKPQDVPEPKGELSPAAADGAEPPPATATAEAGQPGRPEPAQYKLRTAAEVLRVAERWVRTHDGHWPGVKPLARVLECHPDHVRKAAKPSNFDDPADKSLARYLAARKAEHEARQPREVPLTDAITEGLAQTREPAPDERAVVLDELEGLQRTEQIRGERQLVKRQHSGRA